MINSVNGVIDRIEGDFLVIKISGDQDLYWPKNNINFNFNPGEQVYLQLTKEELVNKESQDNAKGILRQIFQTNA